MTLNIIEQGETKTDWTSPGGGTTHESTRFLIEHDAGASPRSWDIERLVSWNLSDGDGYIGTNVRVYRQETGVKVYGLAEGREASRYTVTVEKEW